MQVLLISILVAAVAVSASAAVGSSHLAEDVNFYDICDQVTLLGYPCVHVNVTTPDGFILDVIRMPSKKANPYAVYLQHGLVDVAVTWVMNAHPHQNLGCLLHDEGYDVWMNNARANHYSMANTKYNQSSPIFWYRTDMDEMAAYDLTSVIDTMLETTGRSTLTYVGHSQGGMMGFAAFSTSGRAYASKVDLFVGLAPACYVSHTTSIAVKIAGKLSPAEITAILGTKGILESDFGIRQFSKLCPDLGTACVHGLASVFGYGNDTNINETQLPILTRYDPGGTSVNNMIHWSQMIQTGVFQMHDYGAAINMEFYNQTTPPPYDIANMTGPNVALFFGGSDALVSPEDATILMSKIPPSLIVHNETVSGYNHMELVWGLDAHTRLYPTVLELIRQHKK